MQPRPHRYPGEKEDGSNLEEALHASNARGMAITQWARSPLETPVPPWLVQRYPNLKDIQDMQTSVLVGNQLRQALCVERRVPTPDLRNAAAWIEVRFRLLFREKQHDLVSRVCASASQFFPDAQPWRPNPYSHWGVAFTYTDPATRHTRTMKVSFADFVADYLEPIYRGVEPPLGQREQKETERGFLRIEQNNNEKKEREARKSLIDRAHALLGDRLAAIKRAMEDEEKQKAAARREQTRREREAQRRALEEEEYQNRHQWLAEAGPDDTEARLSTDLHWGGGGGASGQHHDEVLE